MIRNWLYLDGQYAVRPHRLPQQTVQKQEFVQPKPAPRPKIVRVNITPQTNPEETAEVVHRNLEYIATRGGRPVNDAFIPTKQEIVEKIRVIKDRLTGKQTNAVQELVKSGHAEEVTTPTSWTAAEPSPHSAPPAPPWLLQTDQTALSPGIEGMNQEAWEESVRNLERKEVIEGDTAATLAYSMWKFSPWSVFSKDGQDIDYSEARNKKAYALGAILGTASKFAAGELIGIGLGEGASWFVGRWLVKSINKPTLLVRGSKLFSFGSRHPNIWGAIKGTFGGIFFGGEATKGYLELKNGEDPFDVAMDIAGDFAFWGGMGHGLSKTDPRFEVRGRQFIEGNSLQIDVYKGDRHIGSVKLLNRKTQNGILTGVGVHKPSGSIIRIVEKGSRDVDLVWAETPGTVNLPGKTFWTSGKKYWIQSKGGPKLFYLYDPPQTEEVSLSIPEFRPYLRALRPSPPMETKSAAGIMTSLGADMVISNILGEEKKSEGSEGSKDRSSSNFTKTEITSQQLTFRVKTFQPPRVVFNTKERQKQNIGLDFRSVIKEQQKQRLKSQTEGDISFRQETSLNTKTDTTLRFRIRPEPLQMTRTDTRVKQSTKISIGQREKPRQREMPKVGALFLSIKSNKNEPNFSSPKLKFGFLLRGKKKRAEDKKKPKKKNKGIWVVLGEIDLFAAEELDAAGIGAVKVNPKRFMSHWQGPTGLFDEPLWLVEGFRGGEKEKAARSARKKRFSLSI